jgi:23S rRNA U2552 (ribose-2'-O)-methylase RlmE/FtsJ
MYQHRISTQVGNGNGNGNKEIDIVALLKPEYINLNSRGFADLLSCCLETTNDIRWAKDKIEHIKEPVWEEIKKATNPYELIYAAPHITVASLKPLSRSFFKMIEMINEFVSGIIDSDMLVSLHIAEGPGGFIEATRHIRKLKRCTDDIAFGITLINKNDNGENVKHIPAWKQSNYFLRNHPEVIISYGVDGTGNIYNPDNINHLYAEIQSQCSQKNINLPTCVNINNSLKCRIINTTEYTNNMFARLETEPETETVLETDIAPQSDIDANVLDDASNAGNACNAGNASNDSASVNSDNKCREQKMQKGYTAFITADGGFDYSIDYNYQEQASSKLIFSQIITALKCQALEGIFICKIFDMNLFITVEMIYLLNLLYKEVVIYKPFTSRIANSEKYLICTGFKGIDNVLLDKLLFILAEWNKANLNNKTFNRLFTEIPTNFIDELKRINKIIVSNQINVINNIMHIYHNKLNLDAEWKKENFKKQYTNAIEWCKKYNIPFT